MNNNKPKILVFASGSKEGGGSGFENLVSASRSGSMTADIVGVVSNHEQGGVRNRADRLQIPFIHFPKPWDAETYQRIASESGADLFALSGWLKLVTGLDSKTRFNSRTVINIHPGLLPEFGGAGLYGHYVHEAVISAYVRGEVTHSGVSMHFVTEEYYKGPIFFRCKVKIEENDTPESLGARVNQAEHIYQPKITDMVATGLIRWDGADPNSLQVPEGYSIESFA